MRDRPVFKGDHNGGKVADQELSIPHTNLRKSPFAC